MNQILFAAFSQGRSVLAFLTFILLALIAKAEPQAQHRFLEFFAATIRNPHARRAYAPGVGDFLSWCAARSVVVLEHIQRVHLAA